MEMPPDSAAENRRDQPDAAAIESVQDLSGADLGMAVAREVMQWRSDHEQFADCWVDANDQLTGYYYGHPFSPYRDRNALAEVWKRIDELKLRRQYLECLSLLLQVESGSNQPADAWTLHVCRPEPASRAAVLAVRTAV